MVVLNVSIVNIFPVKESLVNEIFRILDWLKNRIEFTLSISFVSVSFNFVDRYLYALRYRNYDDFEWKFYIPVVHYFV